MTAVNAAQAQQLVFDLDPDGDQQVLAPSQAEPITRSVLVSYRAAALAVVRGDTRRACARKEIFKLALQRGLVPSPGNVPLLQVALRQLVQGGKLRKVARGYYRAASDGQAEAHDRRIQAAVAGGSQSPLPREM
jgi:hypothetical protein